MWIKEPVDGKPLTTTDVALIRLPHPPYPKPGEYEMSEAEGLAILGRTDNDTNEEKSK